MQVCKVCSHRKRLQIDRRIVAGAVLTELAKKYHLPYHSVYAHSRNHVSRQLLKSQETKELLHNKDLLAEIQTLYDRSKDILDKAENSNKLGVAVGAIREIRGNLEFIARLAVTYREQMQNEKRWESAKNINQNLSYGISDTAKIVETLMDCGALTCPRCNQGLKASDSFVIDIDPSEQKEKPRMIRTTKPAHPDIVDDPGEKEEGQIEVWEGGKLIGREKVEGVKGNVWLDGLK